MSPSENICDVLIAGGGPVGVTLARLLADTPLRAKLVTPGKLADGVPRAESFRPLALSHPTLRLLDRLDLSSGVSTTPIRTIHVSQQGRFGRTVIRADEHGLPGLGYVVDATALAASMLERAQAWHFPGQVTSWSAEAGGLRVELADADGLMRQWHTQLLVVADGGGRHTETVRDYGQTGIVATVKSERAHDNVAWERFTPAGPLALLPYNDRYAVVWSVRTDAASALMAADDAGFCAALQSAFGDRLGRFTASGTRASYPLTLRRWAGPVVAGVIAIGNAAQTLHPVAGQGLNLGLRDSEVLAARIKSALNTGGVETLANEAFTRGYQAARAADRLATITATDVLARLFTLDFAPIAWLRGSGLAALDLFPPARAVLARRMMLGARGLS